MDDFGMAISPGLRDAYARSEKATNQLQAIASVLGRVNRIVTGEPVVLTVAEHDMTGMNAPGWTDGEQIWLNGPDIRRRLHSRGYDSRLIMALKGVNYHELAHVLYTPKVKQEICRTIWNEDSREPYPLWYSFNILEDLRAEMLFVTDYTTALHYFTNTVAEWITQNPVNKLEDIWPLLSGRMFLPPDLRRSARDAFALKHGRDKADAIEGIARQYLRITFPQHTNKAHVLVRKLAMLLYELQQQNNLDMLNPPSGNHHDPQSLRSNGQPGGMKGSADSWRQKEAAQDRDDFLDELEEFQDESMKSGPLGDDNDDGDDSDGAASGGNADDADDDGDEAEGEGPGQGGSEEDGDEGDGDAGGSGGGSSESGQDTGSTPTNANDGSDDVASQTGGETSSSDESSAAGTGSEGVTTGGSGILDSAKVREEVLEAAESALSQSEGIEAIREDLNTTMDAIRREIDRQVDEVVGYQGSFSDREAFPAERLVVRNIISRLDDLRVDLEPVWVPGQPSGALNVRDAMLAQPGDLDVFDLWNEGSEEDASTEIVILLDQSASMHSIIDKASQVMWTLKRAFDETGIRTTILGYADSWHVLYQPHDKAISGKVRMFPSGGSTNPDGALKWAERILSNSSATNRLLLSITDGQWMHSEAERNSLSRLRHLGAKTIMVNLSGHLGAAASSRAGRVQKMDPKASALCWHEFGYILRDVSDIVHIMETMVAETMAEVRRGAAF